MKTNTPIADSKLINFKFTGTGELFDNTGQPSESGPQNMVLEYTLDTKELTVDTDSMTDLLREFSFSIIAGSVSLTIGDNSVDQDSANSNFNGIAVSDSLDFWENTFSIKLGNASFDSSQWTRHGAIDSIEFVTVDGILNYFSTADNNGEWYFSSSDGTTTRGVFSSVLITALQSSPAPRAPGSININVN